MVKKLRILLVVVLLLGGLGFWWIRSARGFSAREQPTSLEATLARAARGMAIPAEAREMKNPVPLTPELMDEARRHFADHCSSCHANDGSGNTEMGRNLYPKAPDMRLPRTQSLSDGEIYFIIHNGIRLSGMPAWGPPSGEDRDSWALVHFIRRLPNLSAVERKDMEQFNPQSPMELKEQKEEEDFLNGTTEKK
jgi:mono/diheme cytochrome c family protein